MTSRRQRFLAFAILTGVVLASLGWLAVRPMLPTASGVSQQSEEARQHDLALRDLKETQDEVAKMKAHGIGMRPAADQKSTD
jgi:hypothetical protein